MITLVETDIVKSVLQNIRIILTTPKGSDIHRPEFGSNLYLFIDQPLTSLTKGKIKAEIVDAIETWEERVKVKEVDIVKSINGLQITLTIEIPDIEQELKEVIWL